MRAAVDPAVSLSTHSLLPMVLFVSHIDQGAPSASKVVDDGKAPDSNEPEMGRRGSGCTRGEEYEGSLVRLRCRRRRITGGVGEWSGGMAWPAVGVVYGR